MNTHIFTEAIIALGLPKVEEERALSVGKDLSPEQRQAMVLELGDRVLQEVAKGSHDLDELNDLVSEAEKAVSASEEGSHMTEIEQNINQDS